MEERAFHKGFTLIELLIVISIMAILTLIAMANYSGVQRQVRLDFAADSLVSAIKEQIVYAKSGAVVSRVDGAGTKQISQCFALKVKAEPNGGLWSGQSDYIGVTGGATPGSSVDTCTILGAAGWMERSIFDSGIKLKTIKIKNNSADTGTLAPDEKELYFKPPFGQVLGKESDKLQPVSGQIWEFTIEAADESDPVLKSRIVQYNMATGEVKRVKNAD